MHSRQAWGPLVRGFRFEHPSIIGLAAKYGKTPAQVLLRYSLQKVMSSTSLLLDVDEHTTLQGYIPIPKSSSKARIVSNTHIYDFELSQDEVDHLDTLDEGASVLSSYTLRMIE